MSVISWITPKGSLGSIPETQFYIHDLVAQDSDEQSLFYSVISGDLPGGMHVNTSGVLAGTPSIDSPTIQSLTYTFTVRATNPDGNIADRSFALTVGNVNGPEFIPRPDLIGSWFDGNYLEYQFSAINDNSSAQQTYRILLGSLPDGVTLSTSGKLSGYLGIIQSNTDLLGFEAGPLESLIIDVPQKSTDKYYNFVVEVTDGLKFDTVSVRLLVVSKGNYTADNFITSINNTFIKIDADNKYRPIILNIPEVTTTISYGSDNSPLYSETVTYEYPTLISGDTFAYKLLAYDPEEEPTSWRVDEAAFSGMDELDRGRSANVTAGNGTVGPYTIDETPVNAYRITVRINGEYLTPVTDYNVASNQITFTYFSIASIARVAKYVTVTAAGHAFNEGDTVNIVGVTDTSFNGTFTITSKTDSTITYFQTGTDASSSGGTLSKYAPKTTDNIEILYVDLGDYPAGTGYDTLLFDQGIEGLPAGISIQQDSGWLYGTLPPQAEDEKIYSLNITAYRTSSPSYVSDLKIFTFKVKRSVNETITWHSPELLGDIDNGAISELGLIASNNLGKELEYSLTYNPYKRVPQGLKLLRSGRFIGRVTFRFFSLDGSVGKINLLSTQDISVGMTVQGVGVAAGCEVTAIINDTTIEVRPAIYVTQGSLLTFTSETTTKVASATTNAVSTAIDGGGTTFDQDCYFTAKAEAIDGSISSTKNFRVHITTRNLAPYENLWLKSLPSAEQRRKYLDIVNDQDLFPTSLVYRPDDPYFGVRKSLKILLLAGLSPAQISTYTSAIENNHYTKNINFGDIKTARAIDYLGNITYEVIYVDAIDTQQFDTVGPSLQKTLSITNDYLYNGNSYNVIYPNSFNNMQYRIDNAIGYTNRGAIPAWMTSVQENGLVLGPINAVVLAYVIPGAAKLVQYRLKNTPKWPNANFSFVADRYQWENYLSKYYDTTTSTFKLSKETSFDKYAKLSSGSEVIVTEVQAQYTNANVIQIEDNISIGVGWDVSSVDTDSIIPVENQTHVTSINGNLITLSDTISSSAGAYVKIDGTAAADYAVFTSFDSINGATRSNLILNGSIDRVSSFVDGEKIIFAQQSDFQTSGANDGWMYEDRATSVPGYLDKLGGLSTVNQRSGIWTLNFITLSEIVFDSDEYGFDSPIPGAFNGYFDQGGDTEVQLDFYRELIVNQTIKIRSGRTYPATTLQYKLSLEESIPRFIPLQIPTRTAETTFDGGSCICREAAGDKRGGIRGGTVFSTNRDKYEVPESLDKYIKFPQNGVFV